MSTGTSQPQSPPRRHAGGLRSRWAAIGAAVAISIGAGGGLGLVGAAGGDSGAGYTAITPCRLVDTRQVDGSNGPRITPIGDGEEITVDARGARGKCKAAQLPTDATALALNVTALGASEPTFITFWPGGPRPEASSLNPVPNTPAAPNAVITQLGTSGSFKVFNNAGRVTMIIDVVGYFTGLGEVVTQAEMDDRFENFFEILFNPNGAVKTNTREIQELENHLERSQTVAINRHAFQPASSAGDRRVDANLGAFVPIGASNKSLVAPVQLPDDVIVNRLRFRAQDNNNDNDLKVELYQVTPAGSRILLATATSTGAANAVREFSTPTLLLTALDDVSYEVEVSSADDPWPEINGLQIVGVFIDYTTEVTFSPI